MGISVAVVFALSAILPAPMQAMGRFDTTEFMLDTTSNGHFNWAQWDPAVAFNGENYLVAWRDSANKIRCSRVSPDGAVLDPAGTVVYNAAASHGPEVSSSGSDFLVVWDADYSRQIFGARVTGSGVVLDNITISHPTHGYRYYPKVAYDGTNYLVVWHDSRDGRVWDQYSVHACRVSPSGAVLDTPSIRVSAVTSYSHDNQFPSVASDGNSFLVAWETNVTGPWGVRFTRITGDGIVLDSSGVMLNQEGDVARTPSVAFDGTNYLVTWSGGAGLADIEGKRVSPDGVVLDRTPIAVSSAPDVQEQPQVAYDGVNYVAVWQDLRSGSYDVYGARIAPDGTVLDPDGFPVCHAENNQEVPGLAAGPGNLLVAWQDKRYDVARPHIYAALLDSTGVLEGPEIPIPALARRYSTQTRLAASYDGANYFVVWQDSQPGPSQWDILGARVTPTGTVLDVPPVHVSSAPDFQWTPAVAFGGSEYFVTWQDRRFGASAGWAIYGARVTTSGTVLDSDGILIQRQQGYNDITPAVAFDGTNFLVLWNQGWTYGRFVNQAGQLLDSTPFPVTTTPDAKNYPCATFGMGSYLVAWADNRESPNYTIIFATRLNEFGGRRDTGDLRLSEVLMALPAVTSDGTNFLVVWQDAGSHTVFAGRVAGQGGILPPESFPVCAEPAGVRDPSAAFDGDDYIVAWQDNRRGNWDIYGARVNRSLTKCDTFPICTRPKDQTQPAIVNGPGGQVLATFTGVVDSVGGNSASCQRIWGNLFSRGPMPPALLWPPDRYHFAEPPVWLLVDTTLDDVDSFDFYVRYTNGDTVWHHVQPAPCCTVPDTTFHRACSYLWSCRVHSQHGWTRYTTPEYQFWADFPVAVAEPAPPGAPVVFSLPSVSSRRCLGLCFSVSGIEPGATIEVSDISGRLVQRYVVRRKGPLTWDLQDGTGKRVAAGLYFARLTYGRGAIIRKFVLVD